MTKEIKAKKSIKQYEKEYLNKTYNHLTIIGIEPKPIRGMRYAKVRCECGNETTKRLKNITTGHTKSCGCLRGSFRTCKSCGTRMQYADRYCLHCGNHVVHRNLDCKPNHRECIEKGYSFCVTCGKQLKVEGKKQLERFKKNKKQVIINLDKYGMYLNSTYNGFQWASLTVDNEMLYLIKNAIDSYFQEIITKRAG